MACNCGGGAKVGYAYKITSGGALVGYALTIGEARVRRGIDPTVVIQQVPTAEAEAWLAAQADGKAV